MVKPFEELKKQALARISEEEFNRRMNEKQKQMGDVPRHLLAYAVLFDIGLKVSQIEFPEQETYDAKSISEREPNCFLNIPVYLLETRKVKTKKGNIGQMHRAVDKDYHFFDVADWNLQIDAVDDVARKVMLHSVLYTTYQGRPQLGITKKTKMNEIQQGGFKSPPPTLIFNGLEENKLLNLEGYGVFGSIKMGEKKISFEMSDSKANGVKVVLFSRVFDPLERTLKIPLEKLDWCKLRVVGNYIQKEDRATYSQFDVFYAMGVEVLDYYGSEEKQEKKVNEKPQAQLEWLDIVLLEPLDEIDFLEKLEELGCDAEAELERLQKEGIVKVEDGVVRYITNVVVDIPNKKLGTKNKEDDITPKDAVYMGADASGMEKDITNIGENELAITMAEVLAGLDKNLQKLKDSKGVKFEEWKTETEKTLHTQVKDSDFEKIMIAMSMAGAIYEPIIGRWRKV